jgi:putative protease
MKDVDLDSTMDSLETMEAREAARSTSRQQQARVLVGTVEGFFDKIGVVAIRLSGTLKVGDVIEIGTEEEAVRQRVLSMQINREDVEEASEGDSVGIKLKYRVGEGESVYKL